MTPISQCHNTWSSWSSPMTDIPVLEPSAPELADDRVHRRRWATLAVLCVSLLVIVIDNTIVNVALPTLVRDLGTSITDLQWVVDAYTLVFAGARERALAIGLWSGVAGIAVALGPVTGGFLLEHFWWGSVFIVNVPIVIAAIVAGHFLVPNSRNPEQPKLDLVGAGLSVVGL